METGKEGVVAASSGGYSAEPLHLRGKRVGTLGKKKAQAGAGGACLRVLTTAPAEADGYSAAWLLGGRGRWVSGVRERAFVVFSPIQSLMVLATSGSLRFSSFPLNTVPYSSSFFR